MVRLPFPKFDHPALWGWVDFLTISKMACWICPFPFQFYWCCTKFSCWCLERYVSAALKCQVGLNQDRSYILLLQPRRQLHGIIQPHSSISRYHLAHRTLGLKQLEHFQSCEKWSSRVFLGIGPSICTLGGEILQSRNSFEDNNFPRKSRWGYQSCVLRLGKPEVSEQLDWYSTFAVLITENRVWFLNFNITQPGRLDHFVSLSK